MFHLDQYQKRLKFWGHILQTSFFFLSLNESRLREIEKIYSLNCKRFFQFHSVVSASSAVTCPYVTSLRYMAGNSVMLKLKLAGGMYCFAGSAFRSAFRSGRGMGVEAVTKSGTLILG